MTRLGVPAVCVLCLQAALRNVRIAKAKAQRHVHLESTAATTPDHHVPVHMRTVSV